ncbi:hypothetical protein EJB05_01946, partial [Eragrostis curvula]
MDRVVRIFHSGSVNDNGEFVNMKEDVCTFGKSPNFSEVVARAKSIVGVGSELTLRGRFDAGGGGRAHYVLLNLKSDEDWTLYRECLKEAQVRCAEVVVRCGGDNENHEGGVNMIPLGNLVMAPHPLYPLLDADYDAKHRAHLITDNLQVLSVLRPRTHSAMRWHERYSDYIRRAGFLPLARIVNAGLPTMDGPALTALVDRWRPETHTFHLPCGELTVTLQDVAMILGLPIDGHAVTGFAQPHGWRDTVEHLLGIRPPEPAVNEKDKKPSGVSSAWLTSHFNNLDDNADEGTVERFARAWLWHLVGGYLFPDASGNTISWLFLPILGQQWENIATYSWGSATLAWLYRSLCEACTRTGGSPTLGGCAYLLQIWMWERFPVGRPDRGPAEVGASPSAATSSRSRRQSQSRQPSDSEEDDASEEHDPSYGQDIIASSQLGDAPAATQQSVRRAGRRRARDTSEVGSANILGTNPGRQKKKKNPYTPSGR